MSAPALVLWAAAAGVLFDLDGVITPTAAVHEAAWAELFTDYDFEPSDYLRYIDGKPRYDGVASFLESRDAAVPVGTPDDPPDAETVCGLGNRKNEIFNRVLARDGVKPYPGSLRVLDALDQAGIPTAIVSSSRNARAVLQAAGLIDRFPVIVDGITAADEHLAGKPAPDMFLRGAELLGVEPAATIAVEDATSGVAAAAAGGFMSVIGVDRSDQRAALYRAGATIVVNDLSETLDKTLSERCGDGGVG